MRLSKAGVYTVVGLVCIMALGYFTLHAHANVDPNMSLGPMRSAQAQIDLYRVQLPEAVVCTSFGAAQGVVDLNFGKATDADQIAFAYGKCGVVDISNLTGTFKHYDDISVIGADGMILIFEVSTFVDSNKAHHAVRFVIATQLAS